MNAWLPKLQYISTKVTAVLHKVIDVKYAIPSNL